MSDQEVATTPITVKTGPALRIVMVYADSDSEW